jgi:hypothetical protein
MACGPFVPESFRILSEGMTSVILHPRDVRMFGAGRQVEPGVLLRLGYCRRPRFFGPLRKAADANKSIWFYGL